MTKALVVEDNLLNMELVLEILNAKGFAAEGAMNGEDAVNKAEQETYDLIITDIGLPGMNGIEVAKRIRGKPGYENTPVLALTAYATGGRAERERFRAEGFEDVVPKPLHVVDFMNQIEKYRK
ncbi:MAG: response regulator [Candidatus Methanoperedens sp.]|nr:response regulator [Candidatus Methanoperedens sp.]